MANVYDFSLPAKKGGEVKLSEYRGKVLLIVNSATGCGFTPQYEDLEAMYGRLKSRGFEILDIPCDQFGHQAPGSDDEITEFCGELPLYTWLKAQKGFESFDADNKLTPLLEQMFDKADPDWRTKSDIKWNFTKFLVNRDGEVVARFEPTKDMGAVEECVKAIL